MARIGIARRLGVRMTPRESVTHLDVRQTAVGMSAACGHDTVIRKTGQE